MVDPDGNDTSPLVFELIFELPIKSVFRPSIADSAQIYLNRFSILPIEYTIFPDGIMCVSITIALFIGTDTLLIESFHIVSGTVLPPLIFATKILSN